MDEDSDELAKDQPLSDALGLMRMAAHCLNGCLEIVTQDSQAPTSCSDIEALRRELRSLRLRATHFNNALGADPGWAMLLDLALARLNGKRVSVSSLCIASGASPTTALRLMNKMAEQGFLKRLPDETDGRPVHVELSDRAFKSVIDYVRSLNEPIITGRSPSYRWGAGWLGDVAPGMIRAQT